MKGNRRGTPRTDAVEAITHIKRGEMVDYDDHWLWTPLCEAMEALTRPILTRDILWRRQVAAGRAAR